ncbi:hypothetical protein MTO96_048299 [Rhipicephalus appendiculatus]
MASPSTSMVRCLLMIGLLVWHGGVLTPVNCQVRKCGEWCGTVAGYPCVPECHCVFYTPGDLGMCLPHGQNASDLPPL